MIPDKDAHCTMGIFVGDHDQMSGFVFQNKSRIKCPGKSFFERIADVTVKETGLKRKNYELGIFLVSPAESKKLNAEFRLKDSSTNVLSFPSSAGYLRKYGIMALGDIFICPSVAVKEAKELKIQFKEHLSWLTIHGVLHLLGYDHEKSQLEARKMEKLEKKILQKLALR